MLIAFFADQLIIQKRKLDFSITKACREQFEAAIILYCTYSPSTALVIIKSIKYVCLDCLPFSYLDNNDIDFPARN